MKVSGDFDPLDDYYFSISGENYWLVSQTDSSNKIDLGKYGEGNNELSADKKTRTFIFDFDGEAKWKCRTRLQLECGAEYKLTSVSTWSRKKKITKSNWQV